ncbi:MAG: homoserine dehydrogenase [Verrucomicrobiales bacterium]|jgi:homoserine dehydrogenase
MANEKSLQIGLAGFGNVGAGVYKNLNRNRDLLRERTGRDLVVRRIVVNDLSKKREIELPSDHTSDRLDDLIEDDAIDIVVELIGGIERARELVSAALKRGKTVVTANKALLAEHGQELFALAEQHNSSIYFEAAVAGGIPIIKTVQESLVGNHIDSMIGIINGTSNYILTRMAEADLNYEDALKEAQQLGYAEADPTLDVNGGDAAHKAVILASLAYGKWLPLDEIHVEGIENVRRVDIHFAEELGYALKLLAVIRLGDSDSIEVRVQPSLLPASHILANVNGVFNAIMVKGDVVGETLFYGSGAGQDPTSSSVISDLADAAAAQCRTGFTPHGLYGKSLPIEETTSQYYLRLIVDDTPGVLAQIATILGQHDVGILSMIQREAREAEGAPIVLMLHDAKFGVVRKAVEEIGSLDCVRINPVLMRVELVG